MDIEEKTARLESSPLICRFMSIDELARSAEKGSFRGQAIYIIDMHAPFKGMDPGEWSKTLSFHTDWQWSSEAPYNFEQIRHAYEGAKGDLAKFQRYLVDYLAGILRRKENLLQEFDEQYERNGCDRWLTGGSRNHFRGVLTDKSFLAKNKGRLEDIMLSFASVPVNAPGDSGFYARSSPYHLAVFASHCEDNSESYGWKYHAGRSGWTYLGRGGHGMEEALGCQAVVESESLLRRMRKIMDATPLYDAKGERYPQAF